MVAAVRPPPRPIAAAAQRHPVGPARLETVYGSLYAPGALDPKSVRQGMFGTCFALAAAAAVAAVAPDKIKAALVANRDGTISYNAQLPQRGPRSPLASSVMTKTFAPRVLVDATGKPAGAWSARANEWWPTMFERALGTAGPDMTDQEIARGYLAVDQGGDPAWVMEQLMGALAETRSLERLGDADAVARALLRHHEAGHPIVLLGQGHGVAVVDIRQERGSLVIETHDSQQVMAPAYSPRELLATFSKVTTLAG